MLFLDADPQANSTQMVVPDDKWFDFYEENATKETIFSCLKPIFDGDASINASVGFYSSDEHKFGFDLIPGHPRLSMIEDILSQSWNDCNAGNLGGFRKTNWLKALTNNYSSSYDFFIIDVGPSLGALNRSVLLNSDFIITPMGSDIFSLIGVSNISSWIKNWMDNYQAALEVLKRNALDESWTKYPINYNTNQSTRLAGFSIQQYVTKSFAKGRRPTVSYDRIIQQIPSAIQDNLSFLFYNTLTLSELNLGDVPYLYSLVPLAQTAKAPMFNLTYSDGLVGSQPSSVKKYDIMLRSISEKILKNIGD